MKKLFTATLLTVAAVPFLMAAPAPKKAQSTDQGQTQTKAKKHKKHKKAKKTSTAS